MGALLVFDEMGRVGACEARFFCLLAGMELTEPAWMLRKQEQV